MPAVGGDSGIPFGNYTLLRRIARGGMAEVFVARQKGIDGFDRLVAIKRILPHLLDDKSFVGMFQDEARLAARLSHPNVIHIYDFGKVDEHFFIAMEFMHGVHAGDLIRLAEEQPMPVSLVARIGADACAGLHYAHKRRDERGASLKLVHRDISPPNLLVSYDGVVKIVDFGIAKAVSSIEQTRPGVVKGKYAYMSPEQTMGQSLDGCSDVFSLAIVLWELLSGKPAVTRTDQVLAMKTIRDGKVPGIEEVRPDVPPALAKALRGALHKDPKKRSNARTFGNDLESFIKSSSEIATRMELGAWLADQIPPDDILGADKTGFGTRQATMATSLKSQNGGPSEMLSALAMLDAPRESGGSRGSVVSALPGVHFADHQPTRVLAAASGNLDAAAGGEIRAHSDNDSVMIDSGIMERPNHTSPTRLLTTDGEYVMSTAEASELGALDYDDEDEATAMVPPPEEPMTDTTAAIETPAEATAVDLGPETIDIAGGSFGGLGVATDVDEEAPAPPLEFVDNDATYEDAQRPPSREIPAGFAPVAQASHAMAPSQPPIASALSQTGPLKARSGGPGKGLWIGAAVLVGVIAIAVLSNMGDSAPAATPPAMDAAVAVVADSGGNKVPAIVVTPLLDAGLAAAPIDAGAEAVVPVSATDASPPTRPGKRPRHKRRPPKVELGRLAIKTSPYSVVYHRGKKLGTTPLANLKLAPGRYRLVFKNPDFKPVTKTAVIRSGETTKLDFALEL